MKSQKGKYAAVFALVSHIQQFDKEYTYKDAVRSFTNGKTESLSDIPDDQIKALVAMLGKLAGNNNSKKFQDDPKDKQRKAIIAIFKKKGKTVQDAITWAENRGVYGNKKKFNEYTGQELYYLTISAESLR